MTTTAPPATRLFHTEPTSLIVPRPAGCTACRCARKFLRGPVLYLAVGPRPRPSGIAVRCSREPGSNATSDFRQRSSGSARTALSVGPSRHRRTGTGDRAARRLGDAGSSRAPWQEHRCRTPPFRNAAVAFPPSVLGHIRRASLRERAPVCPTSPIEAAAPLPPRLPSHSGERDGKELVGLSRNPHALSTTLPAEGFQRDEARPVHEEPSCLPNLFLHGSRSG